LLFCENMGGRKPGWRAGWYVKGRLGEHHNSIKLGDQVKPELVMSYGKPGIRRKGVFCRVLGGGMSGAKAVQKFRRWGPK